MKRKVLGLKKSLVAPQGLVKGQIHCPWHKGNKLATLAEDTKLIHHQYRVGLCNSICRVHQNRVECGWAAEGGRTLFLYGGGRKIINSAAQAGLALFKLHQSL